MTPDSPKKLCSFAQKKTNIRIDKITGITVDEGNVASALVRPISTDVSCINGRGTRPERIERETDLVGGPPSPMVGRTNLCEHGKGPVRAQKTTNHQRSILTNSNVGS
jgi:hypothetical protein